MWPSSRAGLVGNSLVLVGAASVFTLSVVVKLESLLDKLSDVRTINTELNQI